MGKMTEHRFERFDIKMEWLPFPENIPKKNGEYLITLNSFKSKSVTTSYFRKSENTSDRMWEDLNDWGYYQNADVIAYMENPEPY
jgi:hypothetical protein